MSAVSPDIFSEQALQTGQNAIKHTIQPTPTHGKLLRCSVFNSDLRN